MKGVIRKVSVGLFFVAGGLLTSAQAAAVSVNVVGSGSTITLNLVSGFDGANGADRQAVFEAAAQVWADKLVSSVPIVVNASFTSLSCSAGSAVLGSAGPVNGYYNFTNAPQTNTLYPVALVNSLYGSDIDAVNADIDANFNGDLDNNDSCLTGVNWYYGLDHSPSGSDIDFYEVVLHELAHGLGFLSWVDPAGNKASGLDDPYSDNLYDLSTSKAWPDMTATERATSMLNNGNLVWNGTAVNALTGDLTAGVNSSKVQMYAPSSYESGSSVSHFDTALAPNELMEPQYTGGASYDHTLALFEDIGWTVSASSNSAPVISGQGSIAFDEDSNYTITSSDLTVTDSDHTWPADHSITVLSGSNYTLSGNQVIPTANYNGSLTVPVKVNDGTSDSNTYNLSVTVNSINDVPVITGQGAIALDEDNTYQITSSDLTITDPDDSVFSVTVGSGSNYTVTGGDTVVPTADWSGSLTVPVTVNDGEVDSASYDLTVTVNSVNGAPVFTSSTTANAVVGTGFSFQLQATDEESDTITYGVSGAPSWLSSIDANTGWISGTPDSTAGSPISVTITAGDGTDTTNGTLVITVTNQAAPVITGQGSISFDEDGSYTITSSDLTVTDADNTWPTDHSITVLSGSNYTLSGNTIIPTANYNGSLTVPVKVNDGFDDSATYNLTVTVNPVNDAPVFTSADVADATVGSLFSFQMLASDEDGDSITYGMTGAPSWLDYFDTSTGEISGTPDTSAGSPISITLSASDGSDSGSQTFTLTVYDMATTDSDLVLAANASPSVNDVDQSSRVTFSISNQGPATTADGTLTISKSAGSWVSYSTGCSLAGTNLSCSFTGITSTSFWADVSSSSQASVVVSGVVANDYTEVDASDNQASTSLTFNEASVEEPTTTIPSIGAANTRALGIADLQGDTKPELVFVNGAGQATTIYKFNDAFSSLSLHSHLNDSADSYSIAIEDWDGDGDMDLVLANGGWSNEANTVWLNNGSGQFSAGSSLSELDASRDVAVGDFDGNGAPDLVFANNGANHVYLNDGAGSFTLAASLGSYDSRAVAVFDFDWDGDDDIIFANYGYYNLIYINQRLSRAVGTSFGGTAVEVGSASGNTNDVVVADLDGDGTVDDVLTANDIADGSSSVEIYQSDSNAISLVGTLEAGNGAGLSVGDLDGDGNDDIAVLNDSGDAQIFVQSSGSQQFTPSQTIDGAGSSSVVLEDLDGNGEADIIVTNEADQGNDLYLSGEVQTTNSTNSNNDTSSGGGSSSSGALNIWLALLLLQGLIWSRRSGNRSEPIRIVDHKPPQN